MRSGPLRIGAALVAGLALGSVLAHGAAAVTDEPARRVLLFSLPYVSWSDLDSVAMPNLDRFLSRAAVGGLSTRVDERETPLADGYATVGAGARAVGVPMAVTGGRMADEPFGVATAGDAYARRTGEAVTGSIVQTAIVGVQSMNESLHYDPDLGALAGRLRRAGIERVVIGNGDGAAPDLDTSDADPALASSHQRALVLGLMDGRGQVARGRVDDGLLEDHPGAPFGVRLDNATVVEELGAAWHGRAVVLLEASDLVRVARAAPYVPARVHRRHLVDALQRSDELLGLVLDRVDLAKDAVIVFGPAHEPGHVTLTPLALRGPGVTPGLLRSSSTRRAGFVQIHDIAPTVLQTLGIDAPSSMEGRAAQVGDLGQSLVDRLERIRDADAAAQFRDARIGEVYGVLTAVTALVAALVIAALRRRSKALTRAAALVALSGLGILSAAFLVRIAPVYELGVAGFYGCLLAIGAGVGVLAFATGRRRAPDGLIGALLVIAALLTVDAFRGAPWVLNSVLGYSPTVAGRFAGFGNPAYAAYSAAALLAAVLVAHRVGGRRGQLWAATILAAALVVDVSPMLGSDVGGVVSMVPAYAVTMLLLTGRPVRRRTLASLVVAVLAVAAAAALVDLARAPVDRTHLGRLVERIRDNGVGEGWSVLVRKLGASLASVTTSILALVLVVAVVGGVLVWRRERARVEAVFAAIPEWRAGCVGIAVLAILGFVFNDSGMTVPGIMCVVFVASWGHLLLTAGRDDGTRRTTPALAPVATQELPVRAPS